MSEENDYDRQYDRDRAAAYQERAMRDRETNRREPLNVLTLFERLGYDLLNNEDVHRLNENLRYTEAERKRQDKLATNKVAWAVSFVMVVLGAAATSVIQYFVSRWKP